MLWWTNNLFTYTNYLKSILMLLIRNFCSPFSCYSLDIARARAYEFSKYTPRAMGTVVQSFPLNWNEAAEEFVIVQWNGIDFDKILCVYMKCAAVALFLIFSYSFSTAVMMPRLEFCLHHRKAVACFHFFIIFFYFILLWCDRLEQNQYKTRSDIFNFFLFSHSWNKWGTEMI